MEQAHTYLQQLRALKKEVIPALKSTNPKFLGSLDRAMNFLDLVVKRMFLNTNVVEMYRNTSAPSSATMADDRFASFFSKPEFAVDPGGLLKAKQDKAEAALETIEQELLALLPTDGGGGGLGASAMAQYVRAREVSAQTGKNKLYLAATEDTKSFLDSAGMKAEHKQKRLLYQADPWSWGVNQAFVEGGVDAGASFRLKTHLPPELVSLIQEGASGRWFLHIVEMRYRFSEKNPFWHTGEGRPTWLSLEIAELLDSGYTIQVDNRSAKHLGEKKQTLTPATIRIPRAYLWHSNYGLGGPVHGYFENALVRLTGETRGNDQEWVAVKVFREGDRPLKYQSYTVDRPYLSVIGQIVWMRREDLPS